MYSYGPPHMAEQHQDDQLEHTYSSSVRMRDVALKTCQRRWTIGRSGERGSVISVLAARPDDDDDDDIYSLRAYFLTQNPYAYKYLKFEISREYITQRCIILQLFQNVCLVLHKNSLTALSLSSSFSLFLFFSLSRLLGIIVRLFGNGPRINPNRVLPQTQKCYLMPPYLTLCIIRHGSRISKYPGKGVVPSLTPRHSSYWKGSFWVALDND